MNPKTKQMNPKIKQINKKSLCSFEQRDFFIFDQSQEDFSYRNQEANQVASGGRNSSPEFCQFRILREARPAARFLRLPRQRRRPSCEIAR